MAGEGHLRFEDKRENDGSSSENLSMIERRKIGHKKEFN